MMRFRYMFFLIKHVFWLGDTAGIRLLMAGASLYIGVTFLALPEVFDRKYFSVMGMAVDHMSGGRLHPAPTWAVLFFAHGFGVLWRFWDTTRRVYWALAVNWLGWTLWTMEVVMTSVSIGELSPANAVDIPAVLALTIALVRTGLNDEKWTP